jgi:hypothetical protein
MAAESIFKPMTYIECPQCRQRALSVATRCPRCGHNFPTQLIRHPVPDSELHKLRPVLAVAGALVALIGMVVVIEHRAGSRGVTVPPEVVPLDTAPSIPAQPGRETPASTGDSSRSVAPPPSGVRPPVAQQLPRYATTWVNVRGGRSRGAPAVRVLNPGEAVLVDSLRRGWYRVLVNGRALGYVHRAYLDAAPPSPSARP